MVYIAETVRKKRKKDFLHVEINLKEQISRRLYTVVVRDFSTRQVPRKFHAALRHIQHFSTLFISTPECVSHGFVGCI